MHTMNMYEFKIYRGVMKNDTKIEEVWLVDFKLTWVIWRILTRAHVHFKWTTSDQRIMFELKKCRRVMFHNTEDWCKIWGKTDLKFQKQH